MKTRLNLSSNFEKQFKLLPKQIQNIYFKKEKLFLENIFYPSLKTHKLSGRQEGSFSFSVDYHYRVVFDKLADNEVLLLEIGTHEIYN
jgi:mRNA-degrading endonuclease YafQ of YafQ-DinJ toxin-antitoxin module